MSESIEVVVLRMQANIEEIQSALKKAEELLPNLMHKKANGHREKHVKENTQTNFVKECQNNTTSSNAKYILLENLMKAEGKWSGEECSTSSKPTMDTNHTIPLPLNTEFALQAIGATSKAASLLVPATGADHAPRPAPAATHTSLPTTSKMMSPSSFKHNVSRNEAPYIESTVEHPLLPDPVPSPTAPVEPSTTAHVSTSPSVTLPTKQTPACILPAQSRSSTAPAHTFTPDPTTKLHSPTPNPRKPHARSVCGRSLPPTTSNHTTGHSKTPTHALLTHHNNAVAALSAPVSLPATTTAGAKRSWEVIDLVDSDTD